MLSNTQCSCMCYVAVPTHTVYVHTHTHTHTHSYKQKKQRGPHMGWPGGCSTRLLANIEILSSYLILLISKHFYRLFRHRAITLLQRQLHLVSICKQCTAILQKHFFRFLLLLCFRKALKVTEGFRQGNEGMATNFQGTKITCIWLRSINLKHCPFPSVNCRVEAVGQQDKTINFSILKDCI